MREEGRRFGNGNVDVEGAAEKMCESKGEEGVDKVKSKYVSGCNLEHSVYR